MYSYDIEVNKQRYQLQHQSNSYGGKLYKLINDTYELMGTLMLDDDSTEEEIQDAILRAEEEQSNATTLETDEETEEEGLKRKQHEADILNKQDKDTDRSLTNPRNECCHRD